MLKKKNIELVAALEGTSHTVEVYRGGSDNSS